MSVEEAHRLAMLEAEARRLGIPLWQLEAARAVPDNVVRDIVSDAYRPNTLRSIGAKPAGDKGTGWAKEVPLKPVEGLRWIDAQLDKAAELDKADLRARLAKIGRSE